MLSRIWTYGLVVDAREPCFVINNSFLISFSLILSLFKVSFLLRSRTESRTKVAEQWIMKPDHV